MSCFLRALVVSKFRYVPICPKVKAHKSTINLHSWCGLERVGGVPKNNDNALLNGALEDPTYLIAE